MTLITVPTGLDIAREYPSTHVRARINCGTQALREALGVDYAHNARALIGSRMNALGDTVHDYTYDPLARLKGYDLYAMDDRTSTNCTSTEPHLRLDVDSGRCVPNREPVRHTAMIGWATAPTAGRWWSRATARPRSEATGSSTIWMGT